MSLPELQRDLIEYARVCGALRLGHDPRVRAPLLDVIRMIAGCIRGYPRGNLR